ncbi:AgmX/PglI C-terminal domain-containing protein [Myxococcota bacterium]
MVKLRYRLATTAESGAHTEGEVLHVVSQNKLAISHCVADAWRRGERMTGKMEVRIELASNGNVTSANILSDRFVNTILGGCVARRVMEWRFPESGKGNTIVVPFILEATL